MTIAQLAPLSVLRFAEIAADAGGVYFHVNFTSSPVGFIV